MATHVDPHDSDSVYFNDPENVAEMARLLGQDHYIMLPLTAWGEKS